MPPTPARATKPRHTLRRIRRVAPSMIAPACAMVKWPFRTYRASTLCSSLRHNRGAAHCGSLRNASSACFVALAGDVQIRDEIGIDDDHGRPAALALANTASGDRAPFSHLSQLASLRQQVLRVNLPVANPRPMQAMTSRLMLR